MANFKKTGDLYVDKSNPNASDANAGTDPDLPKLTINSAFTDAVSGNIIIVGDGIYESSFNGKNGVTLEGDGVTIYNLDNNAHGTRMGGNVKDMIFINIPNDLLGGNVNFENCFFVNCQSIFNAGGSASPNFTKCRFINSILPKRYDYNFDGCISLNSTFLFGDNCIIKNSDFNVNSVINLENVLNTPISFCNFNNSFVIDGSLYSNLSDALTAYPDFFNDNNLTEDPLYNFVNDELITLDFSVQGNSPLLFNGEFGQNIGSVKRGIPSIRNSDSVQNGIISNIVFDGNRFQIQGSNTTGTITSAVIDFGLTVKSPIINIKGIVNFLDNVPDFDNALRDPNKLDIECRYAIIGEDITQANWKPFLLNEMMVLDNTGKSNGEANFDWNNTVIIPMKQVQYRLTLRQNYNN